MKMLNDVELWRPVADYNGYYEVSSHGRVRSVDRLVGNSKGRGPRKMRGHVMSPSDNGSGYATVRLNKNGKGKTHYIHRLVCAAFHGDPPSGTEVCHYDGNRKNNAAQNLRWDTRVANRQDSKRYGAIRLGSKHQNSKLTETDVRKIRKDGRSLSAIASDYGVCFQLISQIKSRKAWAWLD